MHPLNGHSPVRLRRFALLMIAIAGCGGTVPVNEDVARHSLETALTAWKSGKASASLEQKSPQIIAVDFDWRSGKKLLDFQILDDATPEGVSLRNSVDLTLQSDSSPPTHVVAVYLVTTHPVITVIRQETE